MTKNARLVGEDRPDASTEVSPDGAIGSYRHGDNQGHERREDVLEENT